jgi:1,4-dihydroxy-6-naphthoate synthase
LLVTTRQGKHHKLPIEITVGHTPDADDAFMFYGIATGKVKSEFKINHVIEDIETLNKRAQNHELDVTAASVHAYFHLKDYAILRSGSSFGIDYGPIVIAKKALLPEQLSKCKIAIPGKLTSAALLLALAVGKFEGKEVPFQLVPRSVADGDADAGLVIHEAQISYDRSVFHKVLDLGRWWSAETGGLPVPLGINVASTRSLTPEQIGKFSQLLSDSILYSLENIDAAVNYAMQYGRGQPKDLITRFVKMYVNDLTVDMGRHGRRAIEKMHSLAVSKRLVPNAHSFAIDIV